MTEMYVSWQKGVPQSKEALKILRENNLGIEMSNIDEQVEMVQDAGVKFSAHTPGLNLTLNLAAPEFMEVLTGKEHGPRLFQVIRGSDAPVVGFHLGYSAEKVYKMMAFPNVPTPETIITDREVLSEKMATNLATMAMFFDHVDNPKQILAETLDYSRERPIPWNNPDGTPLQLEEARAHQEQIQKTVDEYGINAALLHVTDWEFIKEIFKKSDKSYPESPIGFLFDIAHNFISADAKIHKGLFKGTTEECFQTMLDVAKERTAQLHLTVPGIEDDGGYGDHHHEFTPGEWLSDWITDLSKMVVNNAPYIQVITLEIKTGLEPIDHAKRMVEQAEYVAKELNLSLV